MRTARPDADLQPGCERARRSEHHRRGVFTWTPTDAQGPGTYTIEVKVTDNGTPPLSTTNQFAVTVNELYLQSSASAAGPYHDEAAAMIDKTAQVIRVDLLGTTSRFYRLRCNLPVRIKSLRVEGAQAVLEYQFL